MGRAHNIDIHAQLKVRTKQAHTDVDTSPLLQCLITRELKLSDYIAALLKLESWYGVYDEYLSAMFSGMSVLTHINSKSELIKTDLVNLGVIPMAPPADDLAKMLRLNFHCSLGALYVIEGSMMGGLVLAPRIEKHFMRSDITHFYNCYGQNKVSFFKQTMLFIQDQVNTQDDADKVIEGALLSFQHLQQWIQPESAYAIDATA